MSISFSRWLQEKYEEWQKQRDHGKSASHFADHLNTSGANLSRWMNGKVVPAGRHVDNLAETLGPEVYDVLGLLRPDPTLRQIVGKWHTLSPSQQKELAAEVEAMSSIHSGQLAN